MNELIMMLRSSQLPPMPADIQRALGMVTEVGERKRPSKKVSAHTKAKRKRTRASRAANR